MDLYADYHPHTSLKGFGFANAEKAKSTLTLLNKSVAVRKKMKVNPHYKNQVVITMYNRAKYHPNRTSDMLEAMVVFKKYLDEHGIKTNGKVGSKGNGKKSNKNKSNKNKSNKSYKKKISNQKKSNKKITNKK
jgi:hypothetical protein